MILGILSKTLALNNVQSYCIQLIVFAIQQLRHMPDGLKNLGASSFRHFGKGERLRGTRASEKCIVTKNAQQISKIETLFVPNPAHLQWAQDQGEKPCHCPGSRMVMWLFVVFFGRTGAASRERNHVVCSPVSVNRLFL